jgi:hypothetical protein
VRSFQLVFHDSGLPFKKPGLPSIHEYLLAGETGDSNRDPQDWIEKFSEKLVSLALLLWSVFSKRDARRWRIVRSGALFCGAFGILEGWLWLLH